MLGFLRRGRHERTGFELYSVAVAAARDPYFYRDLGVPDTLDGRFDMVGLHAFLLIRRLGALPAPGPAVSQALFDAMFADMDINLREMGVSDLSVGKKVRSMWEAFHGRAVAYQSALAEGEEPLVLALERNVWRGAAPPGAPRRLAQVARAQDAHLAAVPAEALCRGQAGFLAPAGIGA